LTALLTARRIADDPGDGLDEGRPELDVMDAAGVALGGRHRFGLFALDGEAALALDSVRHGVMVSLCRYPRVSWPGGPTGCVV
jgi:hypothetical protein